MKLTRRHGRGRRTNQRGIAMLMVITTLMFLVVLVTEIAYSSRVRFLKTAHSRDEIAADYLAQSGIAIYRLILVANKQLGESMGDTMSGMAPGFNFGDALWQMVPAINTGLLRMFFVSGGSVDDDELQDFAEQGLTEEQRDESRESSRFSDKSFLDFDGDFAAEIGDEDRKINVNRLGKSCDGVCTLATLQLDPIAIQLYGLMSGEAHDQWFYDRDIERWELIADMADWIDQDTNRIWRGGYEDNLYNSLDSPYLSKNARFDTKEEIRLVEGWQDDVYERFGDEVTVFGAGKININTASDDMLKGLFKAYLQPTVTDSEADRLLQHMRDQTMIVDFTKPKEFTDWITDMTNYEVREGMDLTSEIKTSSETFLIESTGMVGDSSATAVCVLDFSSSKVGRIKYWRID